MITWSFLPFAVNVTLIARSVHVIIKVELLHHLETLLRHKRKMRTSLAGLSTLCEKMFIKTFLLTVITLSCEVVNFCFVFFCFVLLLFCVIRATL